jgi:hypothetical protein
MFTRYQYPVMKVFAGLYMKYRHCREQNISYHRPIAMPANDVFSV